MSDPDLIAQVEAAGREQQQAPKRPAPGWYPVPEAPGKQRYWDGEKWLSDPVSGNPEDTALLVCGYLLAVFLAPVGLIAGLVIAFRGRSTAHGVAMVILAGLILLAAFRTLG